MTITIDEKTEAALKAISARRRVSVETCLAELIDREQKESTSMPSNTHDFLMNSPLRGSNLDLERSKDLHRELDLA